MPTTLQKAARALARCLLVILLALLGLELLLRILVPERLLLTPVDRTSRIYLPERSRRHPHSQGATNVLHVALVGDSMTAGVGNHRCDRFAERLEWLLNLNDGVTPAEVRTYAKPTATYQQDKLLQQALDEGAKLVVMIIHLNDTENWSRAGGFVALRKRMHVEEPPPWIRRAARASRLAHLVYDRAVESKTRRGQRAYYRYLYAADYSGLEKFRLALQSYRALCESRGVQLVTVLLPLLNQDLRDGRYPFTDCHAIVGQACRDAQLPFVDLLSVFRHTASERVENIAGIDDHPNEIGHRLAADAILAFLLEKKLIDAAYSPRRLEDLALIQKWHRKLRAFEIPFDDPLAESRPAAPPGATSGDLTETQQP